MYLAPETLTIAPPAEQTALPVITWTYQATDYGQDRWRTVRGYLQQDWDDARLLLSLGVPTVIAIVAAIGLE